jgi:hypothetical protein
MINCLKCGELFTFATAKKIKYFTHSNFLCGYNVVSFDNKDSCIAFALHTSDNYGIFGYGSIGEIDLHDAIGAILTLDFPHIELTHFNEKIIKILNQMKLLAFYE